MCRQRLEWIGAILGALLPFFVSVYKGPFLPAAAVFAASFLAFLTFRKPRELPPPLNIPRLPKMDGYPTQWERLGRFFLAAALWGWALGLFLLRWVMFWLVVYLLPTLPPGALALLFLNEPLSLLQLGAGAGWGLSLLLLWGSTLLGLWVNLRVRTLEELFCKERVVSHDSEGVSAWAPHKDPNVNNPLPLPDRPSGLG